jgi:glycosyltransferase involved in cell wall biosynthesis
MPQADLSVLYHLTILPPRLPGSDAVLQEVSALRTNLGGWITYLNPNGRSPVYVPRLGFGFHKLPEIRQREKGVQVHNLFNPDLYPFPVLRCLRKPVIYSLTGGVTDTRALSATSPWLRALRFLPSITVTDSRSQELLRKRGFTNVALVRPGVDTRRFTETQQEIRSDVRLMVGSAPWNRAQFHQKGIDALLRAAQYSPRLCLVFLWRGVLADEMDHRVRQMGLADRVMVLNRKVNVNQVLAGVHASIALATDPSILIPYPHSLVESLAAGKPVIVSRSIAMADYVQERECGLVINHVTPEDILAAVDQLAQGYHSLRSAARQAGRGDFTVEALVRSFRTVYENAIAAHG